MSTKTKTFYECCYEIAKEDGYSWEGFVKLYGYTGKAIKWIERAAELYASEKIREKEHEKNQQIDNIIKKRKKQESEKIKRAIELARETHNSLFIAEEDLIYTPEEILNLLCSKGVV